MQITLLGDSECGRGNWKCFYGIKCTNGIEELLKTTGSDIHLMGGHEWKNSVLDRIFFKMVVYSVPLMNYVLKSNLKFT